MRTSTEIQHASIFSQKSIILFRNSSSAVVNKFSLLNVTINVHSNKFTSRLSFSKLEYIKVVYTGTLEYKAYNRIQKIQMIQDHIVGCGIQTETVGYDRIQKDPLAYNK